MGRNYERFKNNRKKAIIFFALKKFYLKEKYLREKHNNLLRELAFRKKYLIFNSWRNITNSFKKTKIKLINNNKFLEDSKKIEQESEEELGNLKLILENIEKDIQKEINERKSLAKLYDLSLKKGVEAFLRETNYIIDFDSSRPQTPNEKSFIDAENNYNRSIPAVKECWENAGPRSKKDLFYIVVTERGYKVYEGAGRLKDLEKMIFKGTKNYVHIPEGLSTIVLLQLDPEIFESIEPEIPVKNLQYFLLIQWGLGEKPIFVRIP